MHNAERIAREGTERFGLIVVESRSSAKPPRGDLRAVATHCLNAVAKDIDAAALDR